MAVIVPEKVSLSQSWGVQFGDFFLDGKHTDFQDLMVAISQNRATAVEREVKPLSVKITNRNKTLEDLGNVLADLTKLQAQFDSDSKGDARKGLIDAKGIKVGDMITVFGPKSTYQGAPQINGGFFWSLTPANE